MNYAFRITFRKGDLFRTIAIDMETSLYDLALLLMSSLVDKEDLDTYSFFLQFGEDSYLTRKDEQESLFGYSTTHYHILDDESFHNVIVRKADSGSFQIVDRGKQNNLVLDMEVGEMIPSPDKTEARLIDGSGVLEKDYRIKEMAFSAILKNTERNLPLLKKAFRYRRPKTN